VGCHRELVNLDADGNGGSNPLIEAIRNEAWDAIELLLDAVVDVDFRAQRTGESALEMVCELAEPRSMEMIASRMVSIESGDGKCGG
jgi:ankyrin repeat protein